jgi:oligoribonuclease
MKFAEPQTMLFLDLETTGLNPQDPGAAILEVAMVACQVPTFREIDHFTTPVARPYQGGDVLTGCDDYVRKMHTESGLAAEIASGMPRKDAEQAAIAFYNKHCSGARVYLGGSNPDFDRRWLDFHMPALAKKFHYRNLDINSLFILKEYLIGREKSGTAHRALADCRQAIQGVHDHFTFMRQVFGPKAD